MLLGQGDLQEEVIFEWDLEGVGQIGATEVEITSSTKRTAYLEAKEQRREGLSVWLDPRKGGGVRLGSECDHNHWRGRGEAPGPE